MENDLLDSNAGADFALPGMAPPVVHAPEEEDPAAAAAIPVGAPGHTAQDVHPHPSDGGEPERKRARREDEPQQQQQDPLPVTHHPSEQPPAAQPPMMYMQTMPMGFHPMMFANPHQMGYPQPTQPPQPPYDTSSANAQTNTSPPSPDSQRDNQGKQGEGVTVSGTTTTPSSSQAPVMSSNNMTNQMMYNPYMMMNFYFAGAASAAAAAAVAGAAASGRPGGGGPSGPTGYPAFMMNNPMTTFAPATPVNRGISLELSIDSELLSDYQLLVRQQLELFEAGPQDLESNTQGRKKQVVLGQVGLRCRHCAAYPTRARGRGAVYFPSKLSGVYQAAQNMAGSHLCQSCQQVPAHIRSDLIRLREKRANASGGKRYWSDGCVALGVTESPNGLVMKKTSTAKDTTEEVKEDSNATAQETAKTSDKDTGKEAELTTV